MAGLSKTINLAQATLFRRAEQLLNLFKQSTELSAMIETDKKYFREEADGETLTQIVPGVGTVQVKKPSEASSGTSITLDLAKWAGLDDKTQKLLLKKGVIKKTSYVKAASAAAVVITLNK